MEYHDQQIFALSLDICDDGDVLLRQECCPACLGDVYVRLHRTQIPLVAEAAGFVPADEVERATERLHDRLNLLASLVKAYTTPNDPLRTVVDDLMAGRHESIASQIDPESGTNGGQTSQTAILK